MEVKRFEVKNKNNEKLRCELNISDSNSKICILILHALTGKKENRTIHYLAKNLPSKGFNTLQFDFSGHGESEGKLEECTVTKQLQDIQSVLEHVKEYEIIVLGNSFSVITTLAMKNVSGYILLSGRANYMKYVENLEKKRDKYILFEDVMIDETFIKDYEKYNPLLNIKQITLPILIIHGEKDEVIPVEDAKKFYSESSSLKKELALIPEAGHRYAEIEQKEHVLDSIVNFLK